MFQNLIVGASALIENVKVVGTLEIGKNGMTVCWLAGNSLNSTSLLYDLTYLCICLFICPYLSVCLSKIMS